MLKVHSKRFEMFNTIAPDVPALLVHQSIEQLNSSRITEFTSKDQRRVESQ